MKKRLTPVLPTLVIIITALLLWSGLTNGHDWGDDFSAYIMQAKSITEGKPSEFIEANRFTIEQSPLIGPVAYPWGFPVLLAPFYALFGLNMIALKSVGVVCFLLFLFLLWSGFRKCHSDFWRLVLLCLFAINPTLLRFMNNIVSDIPFLLVSTFGVLLIGRLVIERRRLISPACDQLLIGAAIAAAFFIRANGILLLITLGITQFIVLIRSVYGPDAAHKPFVAGLMRLFSTKHAAVRHLGLNILPYVSFVSFVLAWQALLPEGDSFYARMGWVSMGVIKYHAHYYVDLPALFFDGVPDISLLYGASIPLAIAGAISRYRSDYHMIVYVILTFLLYILYPAQLRDFGSYSLSVLALRFLFPILPFYMSFVLSSLEKYEGGIVEPDRLLRKVICIFPIVLVLLYFGKQSVSDAFGNLMRNRASFSGPFVETSMSMFSYIKDNTKSESAVVFFKPRAMRMMTGRRSLMINKVGELWRGDYLCLYQHNDDQISPDDVRCLTEKETIQPVYKNRDFVVYRLPESHNALRTSGACAGLHARL
jgi:hypothetical protein